MIASGTEKSSYKKETLTRLPCQCFRREVKREKETVFYVRQADSDLLEDDAGALCIGRVHI